MEPEEIVLEDPVFAVPYLKDAPPSFERMSCLGGCGVLGGLSTPIPAPPGLPHPKGILEGRKGLEAVPEVKVRLEQPIFTLQCPKDASLSLQRVTSCWSRGAGLSTSSLQPHPPAQQAGESLQESSAKGEGLGVFPMPCPLIAVLLYECRFLLLRSISLMRHKCVESMRRSSQDDINWHIHVVAYGLPTVKRDRWHSALSWCVLRLLQRVDCQAYLRRGVLFAPLNGRSGGEMARVHFARVLPQ